MKARIDELLNKYIDDDLSSSELKEVKNLIESDPETLKNLKTLEAVDNHLHNMKVSTAPEGFTARVMTKISESIPTIKVADNKSFFMIIISFCSLLFGGLAVSLISLTPVKLDLTDLSLTEKINRILPGSLPKINLGVLTENGFMIASVFACVLIIFGIFIYDSHKNFKKKINGFG